MFFLLDDETCNIFENLSVDDYGKMRKAIIEQILYTDMTKHFAFMNDLKAMLTKDDYDPAGKYKPDILRALLHAADIGNPARPWEISKLWALKILGEFFD